MIERWKRELEEAFEDGQVIVEEGDRSRQMYVIQHGQVAIFKSAGGREELLATLQKGDFFGEMSLLESLPRDATARAVGKTRVLTIHPGGLLVRIRRDPTFALEMLQRLSSRIRRMNRQYMETRSIEASAEAGATEGARQDESS